MSRARALGTAVQDGVVTFLLLGGCGDATRVAQGARVPRASRVAVADASH